jgi:uncharacterized protein (DUF1800 family)
LKVKFYVDSGANIHSCHEEIIDLAEYWDVTSEDARTSWEMLSDHEKWEEVQAWAFHSGRLEMGWEEIE